MLPAAAREKLMMLAGEVDKENGSVVILNKADSVAWALNIRGDDVQHNPLALSYLAVHNNGKADWFIDPVRVPDDVRKSLEYSVLIYDPAAGKHAGEIWQGSRRRWRIGSDGL